MTGLKYIPEECQTVNVPLSIWYHQFGRIESDHKGNLPSKTKRPKALAFVLCGLCWIKSVRWLKGTKSVKTMTRTMMFRQKLFLTWEELTRAAPLSSRSHWDQILRNNNAFMRDFTIPARLFWSCMIWKAEGEVTLASLQVEWR